MTGKQAGGGSFFQQLGNQVNAASRAFANAETTGQKFVAVGQGIRGVWSAVTGGMGNAITRLDAFNSHLISAGKNLQWAGRQIEYRFSLPLIAAGVYATRFALSNEAAFTQLKKVYGLAEGGAQNFTKELGLLRRAFVALSDIFGVQQTQVIAIGALWAEAGDKGTSLAKDVKLTLETMILAGNSYEDAAKSLIILRSAYGLTADGLKVALAAINVIQATTSATFSDLITAITRGGTAAVTAGIDIKHFAAMVTTLVPAAGSAEKAGNALKTIISRLFAPSKQSADMMRMLGINVNDVSYQALNGSQRIELLARKFSGLSGAQKAMAASIIGTRFQFNALATLLRDIDNPLGNYRRSLKLTGDDQKNLQIYTRELGVFLSSQPQAFNIAKTQLQNVFAQIIIPLLPAIIGVTHALAMLIGKFTALDPKTQTFILFMAAGLAIAGPLISTIGALGVLLGLIGKTALFGAKGVLGLLRGFGLLSKAPVKLGLERAVAEAGTTGSAAGEAFLEGVIGGIEAGSPTITTAATGVWTVAGAYATKTATEAGVGAAYAYSDAVLSSLGSFGGETIATETAAIFAAAAVGIDSVAVETGASAGAAYIGGLTTAIIGGGSAFGIAAGADIAAAAGAIFTSAFSVGQAAGNAFDAGVAAGMAEGVGVKVAAGVADFEAAGAIIIPTAFEVGVAAGIALDAGAASAIAAGGAIAAAALEAGTAELVAGAAIIGPEVVGAIGEGLAASAPAIGEGVLALTTAVEGGVVSIVEVLPALVGDGIAAAGAAIGDAAAAVGGDAAGGVILGLEALPTGVTQIIGAALAAGLILIVLFRDKLADGFKGAIGAVANGLAALPRIMGDALVGVWNTVVSIGKAIWQALQDFLNPFQRHSPSLVDLVSLGVDIIARKYRSLRSIGADLRSSIAEMRNFKAATKSLTDDVQNADFSISLQKITKNPKVPNAPAAGMALIGNIKSLQGDLDAASGAYAHQQAVVTRWAGALDKANTKLQTQQYILDAERSKLDIVSSKLDDAKQHLDKVTNAPLKGENAATEAIYRNELATKKYQLALTSLETSFGTLDQIKQKMADINGELELLHGSENDLRLKGAGSDVLSGLRDQEQALMSQRKNLGGVALQMTSYQTTIDKLTLSGQKMQLTFDTTFGDMHHQIDLIANRAKEISFAKVLAATQKWKPLVDKLTVSYDKQNNQLKAQQAIVTTLSAARDKIQRGYDAENKKLSALGNLYDAINQQITEETQLLKDLADAASSAGSGVAAAFGAAGAGKFKTPKFNLKPDTSSLDKLVKQWEDQVKKSFGNLKLGDMLTAPFKAGWHKVQDWWVQTAFPFIKRIPGDVVGWLSNGDNWATLGHALLWPFQQAWGLLTSWWGKTALPWLKNLPGLIGQALGGLGGIIGNALRGLGNIIIAPFKAAWRFLGGGKGSIPYQIGHAAIIFATLPLRIALALGKLSFLLLNWLREGFNRIVDDLPGLAVGMIGWFRNLPKHLLDAVTSIWHLGSLVVGWLQKAANAVLDKLPTIFDGMKNWFASLPGILIGALGDVGGALVDVFKGAWNGLADWWNRNVATISVDVPKIHIPFTNTDIGGGHIGFPSLPVLSMAQGGIAMATSRGTLARIAEAGRNEMVAPLPHGFSMERMNTTLMRLERYVDRAGNTTSMQPVTNNNHTVIVSGNLSFPNIKSGDDAEKLIRNLEALVD